MNPDRDPVVDSPSSLVTRDVAQPDIRVGTISSAREEGEMMLLWIDFRWGGWLPIAASIVPKVRALSLHPLIVEPSEMTITTIGLDLAKNVFQVHAVDEAGTVVVRKALRRVQVMPFFARLAPCLIGIEACGTSHHWARELQKLGHEVRLMPPAYVKAYVKRGKTDAADAEARRS